MEGGIVAASQRMLAGRGVGDPLLMLEISRTGSFEWARCIPIFWNNHEGEATTAGDTGD